MTNESEPTPETPRADFISRVVKTIIEHDRAVKARYPEGFGAHWAKVMRRESVCMPTEPPRDEILEVFDNDTKAVISRWIGDDQGWYVERLTDEEWAQKRPYGWSWGAVVGHAMANGWRIRAVAADEEQASDE